MACARYRGRVSSGDAETPRSHDDKRSRRCTIRNYRYYFAGQSLSLIGTWMQSITQSWLVFTLTHSGLDVGLIVAVQTLPILLLGPIGGTIADRFGKYRILF